MNIKKADNNTLKVIFFTSILVAVLILSEIGVMRTKLKNGGVSQKENTELQLVLDPNTGTPKRGWKTYMMPEPNDIGDFSGENKNSYVQVIQYYYKLDYPRTWKLVDYGSGSIKLYQEKPKPPDEATDATLISSGVVFGKFPKPSEEETAKNVTITKTELKGYKGELRQSLKFKRYYLYLADENSGRYFQISLENPSADASEVFADVIDSLEIYKKTVKVQRNNSSPISI